MIALPPPEIFKAYDIRGLYGEQIDGDVAELIGRAFARVLSRLAGKPVSELRVGSGRDMRLTAPELSARYREGLLARGRHVIDAGRWARRCSTSWSARARLDGGLMCTASHNPKAYTGAKLVREGAIALSGDVRHPGHPPHDRRGSCAAGASPGEGRARARRRGARSRRSTSTTSSRRRRCASSTPMPCDPRWALAR